MKLHKDRLFVAALAVVLGVLMGEMTAHGM